MRVVVIVVVPGVVVPGVVVPGVIVRRGARATGEERFDLVDQ
jgi:hypothetical protein